mgnify:FL=1
MKEYRSIPIGLGLIILVLVGTYYLYIQERQHQKDMRELARHQFYVESDVLSSQGEANLHVTLYFPQLDWTGSSPLALVEESRPIFQTKDTVLVMHQIINELMKGPIEGEASIFSEQAALRQIYLLEDGTAIVDFSQEATQLLVGGVLVEFATLYSIVRSLIENVEEIKRVKFLVEGRESATFAGHISIQQPFM